MASTPIELRLNDGSVIKAEDVNEALKTAVKMKEDTSSALKEEKEKREALEAQVAALSSQVTEATRPKPVAGAFNNDEYFKLLNSDPIDAQNYLDAHRFGIQDRTQVPQQFAQMRQDVEEMHGSMLANQFLQQHYEEFPATPDAAAKLRGRVEELQKTGFPTTIDTMNLAWSQLVSSGAIKPMEKKQEEHRDEPPPSMGGSGSSIATEEIKKAENMTDEDLKKFLISKGMLS